MSSSLSQKQIQTRLIDGLDPLSVFNLAKTKGHKAFYFESSPLKPSAPKLVVIGLGACDLLRDFGHHAELVSNGHSQMLEQSFFETLQTLLAGIQSQKSSSSFRFANGGVFGCIGYDCVSAIEPRLQKVGNFQTSALLPRAEVFVAKTLMAFEFETGLLHLVDASGSETSLIPVMENLLLESAGLEPVVETLKPIPTFENARLKPLVGLKTFTQKVTAIKKHIQQGDIFQAVLSERFECETSASPLAIFKELSQLGPVPYRFFFEFQNRSFFGASPETLVRVQNGNACLNPIAGTRPRDLTVVEDQKQARNLNRSPKEGAEHLMLVDLARNDLGRIAVPGSVQVATFRAMQKLTNVMHLVSEVVAKVQAGISSLEVFKACFPAGTLSGAPKIRALEILAELESVPRGLYGGAVVAFDSQGGLESCISIRALEMQGQTAILRAGAGIVADSKPQKEYEEILSKLKLVRQALANAEVREAKCDAGSVLMARSACEKRVAL